ncbi:MAG TPA: ATPase [Spirochaeta sp.]|nr:ATPase [Spirochaeta sp.]
MSFFTSKMVLLSAVVLEKKSDDVTAELLRLGLLDFVEVSKLFETKDFKLKSTDDIKNAEAGELRRQLETIYKQANLEHPYREKLSVEEMSEYRPSDSRDIINKINNDLQNLREKQKNLHQENLKLQEIVEYLGNPGKAANRNSFLLINKGKPGRGNFDDMLNYFSNIPHFGTEIPESDYYFLVSLKRDKTLVNDGFNKFQWIEHDEQFLSRDDDSVLITNIEKKVQLLKTEITEVSEQLKSQVINDRDSLDRLWKNLRLHELYSSIQNYFSHTERTCLFSGWLPAEKTRAVENAIRKVSSGECIIEWSEPAKFKRESVPVEIKQPKALAPFQMLVENYAVPEYGAVDPTVFVAVAYMIMFGLMFGDAGQGLVIILIGILGRRLIKNASAGIKKLMQLFIYCGSASIIAGVLFGSYFGYPIFPALWFNYHGVVSGHGAAGSSINDVYDILRITIYFGISVISIGLIINWINLYRKRDFFTLFLDKSGILGGWVYGCGVYTSFYFVGTGYKLLPDTNLLTVFFGIPVIFLFFKAPIHFFIYEREEKSFNIFSIIDFIMEWIVEILEIFSGYLANTLSFMRVAGLGIAHVSLMVAFDTIAAMTNGFAAVLILILGNILVIALEGLSAGIQALRLNYYEFFSRYFTGKGIAYNPVSLRSRK